MNRASKRVTFLVSPEIFERMALAASQDGRTLSSWLARQVKTCVPLPPLPGSVEAEDLPEPGPRGGARAPE